MSIPQTPDKNYQVLYHDFTNQYAMVNDEVHRFYPIAKKFVDSVEPEINLTVKSLSANGTQNANPATYQAVSVYMSRFDDFTLSANRLFNDMRTALTKSEELINRVIRLKQSKEWLEAGGVSSGYGDMVAEMNQLIADLDNAKAHMSDLEKEMSRLTSQWQKIKQKMY